MKKTTRLLFNDLSKPRENVTSCVLFIFKHWTSWRPLVEIQMNSAGLLRVRAHLIDLTPIGEIGHSDIVEKITLNLQLNDRLAWNDGRESGLEYRTLNEFSSWLCNRAIDYLNPYTIAAEQLKSESKSNQIVMDALIMEQCSLNIHRNLKSKRTSKFFASSVKLQRIDF